ncbi:MAG: MFS transporter [Leptolyngbyaceae cyanobacterium]
MISQSGNTGKNQVLWAKVVGLAAVQGAIALLWVIYNLYLVDLLGRLGFPPALAAGLLVVENLLAIVMEPLMGSLSDRLQRQLGTRFPLISLGVILTASSFIALPTIALSGLEAASRWLLPVTAVAWALAMTMFRSPALSLLGRYAFGTRLPQAASILTLVGGVAGAMGPLASQILLGWGPLMTFAVGSGVLLVATVALRVCDSAQATVTATEPAGTAIASPPVDWLRLALVFGAGVGVTLGFRMLMLLFSSAVNSRIPDASKSLVLGSIFISLALTAIPAGVVALRLGNRRAMVLGLAGMACVCVLVSMVHHSSWAIGLAWMFGATFSLVSNGTIPFALSMVPAPKAGLGTGIFFSGASAASSLFGAMTSQIQALPASLGAGLGVLALLLAGVCIAYVPRRIASAHS